MRYQRLKYRYAVVLSRSALDPPAPDWRTGRPGVTIAQPHWRPAADVYETATAVNVTIDLAGVAPEEVDAVLYEDALIVSGNRRLAPSEQGGVYHAAEIRQGLFRLELRLPARVDVERVEGAYVQGLLRLALPKVREG
jgi:HSP20 family protein